MSPKQTQAREMKRDPAGDPAAYGSSCAAEMLDPCENSMPTGRTLRSRSTMRTGGRKSHTIEQTVQDRARGCASWMRWLARREEKYSSEARESPRPGARSMRNHSSPQSTRNQARPYCRPRGVRRSDRGRRREVAPPRMWIRQRQVSSAPLRRPRLEHSSRMRTQIKDARTKLLRTSWRKE